MGNVKAPATRLQIVSSRTGRFDSPGARSAATARWITAHAVPDGKKYCTIWRRTRFPTRVPSRPADANSTVRATGSGLQEGSTMCRAA